MSKILILTYQFKNSKKLQIVYHITFISIRRYTGTYDFHARFEENEHKLYCFTTASSKVNLAMGQMWIAESSLILLHDRVIDFACRNKYWNETVGEKNGRRARGQAIPCYLIFRHESIGRINFLFPANWQLIISRSNSRYSRMSHWRVIDRDIDDVHRMSWIRTW